jgi:hypothetical protein
MTREELKTFLNTRTIQSVGGPGRQTRLIPIREKYLHGMAVLGGPDGTNFRAEEIRNSSWICVLDDRDPRVSGPDSFDPLTMGELLRSASLLAIDSAEPAADLYDYFMEEVAGGKRLLVIQTTEARHKMWRGFLASRWHGKEIAEVVPVKNDPARKLSVSITCLDRN